MLSHKFRRFGTTFALLCGGTLVGLLLGEGLVRLVHPYGTVEYRLERHIGPLLVPHQRSLSVGQDYEVPIVTNSAGFHDVEHDIGKPDDVYRIVVLGDSFIEALQVLIEEGFTQQLERRVQSSVAARRVEVINLGISGAGPAQYYHLLKMKGLAYQPI